MSTVAFRLTFPLASPADDVWNTLVDWSAHGDWIPATRSSITKGDGGLGTEFVAISGFGRLALVDRMRVVAFDADQMSAEVEKIGPVLGGRAGFSVSPNGQACTLEWYENVRVPWLPALLAPLAAITGKALFTLSLRRLAAHLR